MGCLPSNNSQQQRFTKVIYLKSQVISGLELTKDNYYVAIDLLEERYGKKQVMVNAHYAKLINLPVVTFKSASLRLFFDTTEKHLRCLHSLGQNDNEMQVLSMMQSKLLQSVFVKLEEMKPEGEEWTVENFQGLLKRHINAQEAGDLQSFLKYLMNHQELQSQTNYIHATQT